MPRSTSRSRLCTGAVVAAALSMLAAPASAQPYPARDITFIVAFAPGGVADTVARRR
jgi:tripartite-type tricarboxylate transporter receptor subunit TctC